MQRLSLHAGQGHDLRALGDVRRTKKNGSFRLDTPTSTNPGVHITPPARLTRGAKTICIQTNFACPGEAKRPAFRSQSGRRRPRSATTRGAHAHDTSHPPSGIRRCLHARTCPSGLRAGHDQDRRAQQLQVATRLPRSLQEGLGDGDRGDQRQGRRARQEARGGLARRRRRSGHGGARRRRARRRARASTSSPARSCRISGWPSPISPARRRSSSSPPSR